MNDIHRYNRSCFCFSVLNCWSWRLFINVSSLPLLIRDSSDSNPRFYIVTCARESQSGVHFEKWEFRDTRWCRFTRLHFPFGNLQSLKRSTFPLERCAERTQSERCVNAERNLVNDMWTVNGERTQNASGAQTRALSERWTQGERKMNDLALSI